MKQAYKLRPEDFRRRIISTISSSRKDLFEEEQKWLDMIKGEEMGKRYYNLIRFSKNHWQGNPEAAKTVAQKISESHKRHPDWGFWNKGLVRSDELKQRIRTSVISHNSDPKYRAKQSLRTQEMWKNPEWRERQIAARIGKTPWNKGLNTKKDKAV
jgi:hypothetical protein